MKKLFISSLLLSSLTLNLFADTNTTESNTTHESTLETNSTDVNATTTKIEKALEKQMKKEAKFAEEQRFYQGDEYDLSSFEIDSSSLDSVPLIEPEYDFSMDHVYD